MAFFQNFGQFISNWKLGPNQMLSILQICLFRGLTMCSDLSQLIFILVTISCPLIYILTLLIMVLLISSTLIVSIGDVHGQNSGIM